jgi:hypothetical protein
VIFFLWIAVANIQMRRPVRQQANVKVLHYTQPPLGNILDTTGGFTQILLCVKNVKSKVYI